MGEAGFEHGTTIFSVVYIVLPVSDFVQALVLRKPKVEFSAVLHRSPAMESQIQPMPKYVIYVQL